MALTDRPRTFFDVQRLQRRRTAVLIAIEVLLLVGVAYVVTLPWQFYDSCSGDSWQNNEYVGCRPVRFSVGALVSVSILVAGYLCVAVLMAQRRAFPSAARPVTREPHEQRLISIAEDMSIASGLPKADVRVLDDSSLNAFATWDKGSPVIVATSGLLEALDDRQLTGVVAHETAHLTNRDARIIWVALFGAGLTIVLAVMATAVGLAATEANQRERSDDDQSGNNGAGLALAALVFAALMWIVAVPAALIVQATISRRREQLADASAVQFTRDPTGLRQALEIIDRSHVPTAEAGFANAALWIRHPGANGRLPGVMAVGRLLDTHPPIADRIAWLRGLEKTNAIWADIE